MHSHEDCTIFIILLIRPVQGQWYICSEKFYTIYSKLQLVLLMWRGFSSLLQLCSSLCDGCSLSPYYQPSTERVTLCTVLHTWTLIAEALLSKPSFKIPHKQQRDWMLWAARMLPLEIQSSVSINIKMRLWFC